MKPAARLIIIPPDPGRKQSHLAVLTHRGGGWWQAQCMGEAKACKAGTCRHIATLAFRNGRRIKPVARES